MNRILLLLLKPLKLLLHLYFKTLRFEVAGRTEFETLLKTNTPLIIALWHNRLFLLPFFHHLSRLRPFEIAISYSRDGDIPSRLVESYKNFTVIRVKHNARHDALHKMVQAIEAGSCVMITPDGPRGPKEEIKPGILFLAQQTKASIIPFKWTAEKSWRLKSWDKFEIPKPFSRVSVQFGPMCPPDITAEELKLKLSGSFPSC